jgi:hypothetical protein
VVGVAGEVVSGAAAPGTDRGPTVQPASAAARIAAAAVLEVRTPGA